MNRQLLLAIAVLVCGVKSLASAVDVTGNNPRFDEYYTVSEQEPANFVPPATSLNPLKAVQDLFAKAAGSVEFRAQVVSLLKFDHHDDSYGNPGEAYNRKEHFGGWIRDKQDDTCLNTRGKVLVRDSKVPVQQSGCTVESGSWDEPYTGRTLTRASQIQIDHFVPLKNAYLSGAWKWDFAKRCLYANYMGNNFHLISADGHENMAKSDNTPQGYMPPNGAYRCQYLAQWLKVKLIWDLGLTPPEKQAMESLVQQNHCDLSQFVYSVSELQTQRRFMADHRDLCQ